MAGFNAGFVSDEEMMDISFDADIFKTVKRIRRDHVRAFREDLDPNLIFSRLEQYQGHPDRVKIVSEQLFPHRPIPVIDLEPMEVEEPETKEHARTMIMLLDCLPDAQLVFLQGLVSTFKDPNDLNDEVERLLTDGNYPKRTVVGGEASPSTSQEPTLTQNEKIYEELAFKRVIGDIKDYIKEKHGEASQIVAEPNDDDYVTCECCCEDHVKPEDTELCAEGGHIFCRTCVRKQAEIAVGENLSKVKCMAANCSSEFSHDTVQRVLKPIVFEKWLQRLQIREVKMADLPNFKTCPHCDYGGIVNIFTQKVFQCLNPSCGKVTCVKESHLPYKCEEVERANDDGAGTSREEEMTDEVVRSCPKCKVQFIKKEGTCNMIRCACGQRSCFACRKPVRGYDHFGGAGCPIETVPKRPFVVLNRVRPRYRISTCGSKKLKKVDRAADEATEDEAADEETDDEDQPINEETFGLESSTDGESDDE